MGYFQWFYSKWVQHQQRLYFQLFSKYGSKDILKSSLSASNIGQTQDGIANNGAMGVRINLACIFYKIMRIWQLCTLVGAFLVDFCIIFQPKLQIMGGGTLGASLGYPHHPSSIFCLILCEFPPILTYIATRRGCLWVVFSELSSF